MTTNKNDLRWRRTSERLKQAFIQELQQHSFNEVTVSQLIQTAHLSRRTFYLHYQDKFDFLNKLENHLYEQLNQAFEEDHQTFLIKLNDKPKLWQQNYLFINNILRFVHQERNLFRALLSVNGDPNFTQKCRSLIMNEIRERVRLYNAHFSNQIPENYALPMITDGLIGLLDAWLNNAHPESVEHFAKIMTNSQLVAPLELLESND